MEFLPFQRSRTHYSEDRIAFLLLPLSSSFFPDFFCLCIWKAEREMGFRGRLPSASSFLKWLRQLGLGQVRARSPNFIWVSHVDTSAQGFSPSSTTLPHRVGSGTARIQTDILLGCKHHRCCLFLLCCNTGLKYFLTEAESILTSEK